MSKTSNYVCIEGYVGSDPQYRYTPSNEEVATFVVGTEDLIFSNIRKQWHSIVIVGQEHIEIVRSNIHKGVKVRITGVIYMHKQEIPVHKNITEIVVSNMERVEILEEDKG